MSGCLTAKRLGALPPTRGSGGCSEHLLHLQPTHLRQSCIGQGSPRPIAVTLGLAGRGRQTNAGRRRPLGPPFRRQGPRRYGGKTPPRRPWGVAVREGTPTLRPLPYRRERLVAIARGW